MVVAAIHQPHYLPYAGLIDKLDQADVMVWLDDAAFSRGGWHNRNRIKTHAGRHWLTVPVHRVHPHPPQIRHAALPLGGHWQSKHGATIRQAYARSAHLTACAPLLEMLEEQEFTTLGQLNLATTELLAQLLDIRTPCVRSSELGPATATKTARLIELCQRLGADTYLAGDGSACYLDQDLFEPAGITLRWQGYTSPTYPQHHAALGFISDLSVLDLLANTGPAALGHLRTPRALAMQGVN